MNLAQRNVIKLYRYWKGLERQAEIAEEHYQNAFSKLTDEELIEVMPKTQ